MAKVHPECDLCGKAILRNSDGEFIMLNGLVKYVHTWHNRKTEENIKVAKRNNNDAQLRRKEENE